MWREHDLARANLGGRRTAASIAARRRSTSRADRDARPARARARRISARLAYSGKINTQANGLFALDYDNATASPARAVHPVRAVRRAPVRADVGRARLQGDVRSHRARPGSQMAVSNMPAAATKTSATASSVPSSDLPEDVDLPAVLRHRRIRARDQGGRRNAKSASSCRAAMATRRATRSMPRRSAAVLQRLFRHAVPAAQARQRRRPGPVAVLRRDGELGRDLHLRDDLLLDPAITTRERTSRRSSASSARDRAPVVRRPRHDGWWDDLWLNEGFATWMGPRRRSTSTRLDADVRARRRARGGDGLRRGRDHPPGRAARSETVEQADQAFDAITYSKGEAVISMLEGYAGEDGWREGIRRYMKRHAYGNTRPTICGARWKRAGPRPDRRSRTISRCSRACR